MYNSEELEKRDLFQIKKLDGFDTQFGHLISLMNYARITTLDTVTGMSVSDLDFLIDEKANSIGMLLFHIASVDFIESVYSIENRQPTTEEIEFWKPALGLGDLGREKIKGNPLEFYLELLSSTRKKTLEAFAKLNDTWLYEETDFWDNKKANNYFKWFHVLEEEINHRGQMRWIKKRILN